MPKSYRDRAALSNILFEGGVNNDTVCDAYNAATRLIDHFPTTKAIFYATANELKAVEGVTDNMARRIYSIRLLSQKGALPNVAAKFKDPRCEP